MTDRDHFAAAALTGLLSASDANSWADDLWADDLCRTAFGWADAMLRERAAGEKHRTWVAQNASLVAAAQAPTKPPTPQADRLTEWERHGSRRWGLGVASDLYDLECRVAALEKANHDAAPAARASVGRPRTDKADLPTRCGTGDTPADTGATEPRNGAVRGPDPDSRVWETHTPQPQATPGECSNPRGGTSEPVAWWLRGAEYDTGCEYEYVSLLKENAEAAAAEGGTVVPLYRAPTLTDAEREALHHVVGDVADITGPVEDTLRGLLERLGGGR